MFDIGLQEMLVVGVIALLVFGPSKLPELGRMFGRAMREFRRASDEFRATVETNLHINDPDPVIASPAPVIEESFAGAPAPTEASAAPTEASAAPAEVAAPEPAPVATEVGTPFCAQRGSRLFHRRECAWVRRIPGPERIELKQISDARDQGFKECPVCEPWEPV
jgi:sec-independent protein translocase protein TatA